MRRVSSAPNLCGSIKSVPHSNSGDKLDKASFHKRSRVQSVSDLVNASAMPLIENQMVQLSQLMSSSKGVASALCFEIETRNAPAIVEESEELASCLSTPLMEEGDLTPEMDIVDRNNNVIVPFKKPRRRVLTRWDVPSRIAKRV